MGVLAIRDHPKKLAFMRDAGVLQGRLSEITTQRGVTLDALVVDACLRIFQEHGYKIPN